MGDCSRQIVQHKKKDLWPSECVHTERRQRTEVSEEVTSICSWSHVSGGVFWRWDSARHSLSRVFHRKAHHCHDATWKRPIKVQNLKPLSLFCFLFRTGTWKNFHRNTQHWKDRKIHCLQACPCLFQPGNLTGWGSEGVTFCSLRLSVRSTGMYN